MANHQIFPNYLGFVFRLAVCQVFSHQTFRYTVPLKIASYVNSCLLKCFIVDLWSQYCLKILYKKLLGYSYFKFTYLRGHTPFSLSE